MTDYKQSFIDFMVESEVLRFGDFTLKSGRRSPFFMNAGAYAGGGQLRRLGEYYARAIHEHFGLDFDVLFGPAYKGIPLAVATVMAISALYGREIRYAANRKEEKDHGDAGILVGGPIKEGDRVVIIEDVTTSGKSIAETYPVIRAQADTDVIGLMVSLDRMERGTMSAAPDAEGASPARGGNGSGAPAALPTALREIRMRYGFPAHAIVTMAEVVRHLRAKPAGDPGHMDDAMHRAIIDYYSQYGAGERWGN